MNHTIKNIKFNNEKNSIEFIADYVAFWFRCTVYFDRMNKNLIEFDEPYFNLPVNQSEATKCIFMQNIRNEICKQLNSEPLTF